MPKDLLKTIMDAAPVAIVHLDTEEKYLFANKFYTEHFNRNNILGLTVLEVVGPLAYQKFKPYFEAAYAGKKVQGEFSVDRGEFSSITVNAIYAPSFDKSGAVIGLVIISEDITERKEIETQLNLSRERLAFALKSGQMGTWDIDLKTDKIYCSEEMLELWDITNEELQNSRPALQKKVHPDDLEGMREAINTGMRNNTVYEHEFRIHPTKDSQKWIFSRGRSSENGTRFSGVVYDITEKKTQRESSSRRY